MNKSTDTMTIEVSATVYVAERWRWRIEAPREWWEQNASRLANAFSADPVDGDENTVLDLLLAEGREAKLPGGLKALNDGSVKDYTVQGGPDFYDAILDKESVVSE